MEDFNPYKSHLAESFIERKREVQGDFLTLMCDWVRLPNNTVGQREYLQHPGAAVILALLPNRHLILERQFRYPVNKECIELPAGKLEPNEDPLICAKRELLEETGYISNNWRYVTSFLNAIGYSNEKLSLYLAKDVVLTTPNLDKGEFLEVFSLPLPDCLELVKNGTIDDVKTMIGIFWLYTISDR